MTNPQAGRAEADARGEAERLANLTREVMQRINACTPGTRLAEVPTLFAFGPIHDAIVAAEQRGRTEAEAALTEARAEKEADRLRLAALQESIDNCAKRVADARRERDEARKDVAYHADCRPNRKQAEAWRADAKAMNDKWADTEKARREAVEAKETAEARLAQAERERDEARRSIVSDEDVIEIDEDGKVHDRTEVGRLRAERDALTERLRVLKEALRLDQPWPVTDILLKLADAADHLLRDHNCDRKGWEEVGSVEKQAREVVKAIRAALHASASSLSQPPTGAKET